MSAVYVVAGSNPVNTATFWVKDCPSTVLTLAGVAETGTPTERVPIEFDLNSTNQRAPPGPVVIPSGPLFFVGMATSVMTPEVVIRPTALPLSEFSVNQSAPSGPGVIPDGPDLDRGRGNCEITPDVVTRPIL